MRAPTQPSSHHTDMHFWPRVTAHCMVGTQRWSPQGVSAQGTPSLVHSASCSIPAVAQTSKTKGLDTAVQHCITSSNSRVPLSDAVEGGDCVSHSPNLSWGRLEPWQCSLHTSNSWRCMLGSHCSPTQGAQCYMDKAEEACSTWYTMQGMAAF